MAYLRLLRIPWLVIIALSQIILHFLVTSHIIGMDYAMNPLLLALIVATTTVVAAGGFVINDYYDMRIDEINHPLTRIVGNKISKREAMNTYTVLVVIGFILSIALGIVTRNTFNSFIFVSMIGLLWFYSSSYKRQLIIGNIITALSFAMVPFILALYEGKAIMEWWTEKLVINGIFVNDENLSDVVPYINENYQTIGYFSIMVFIFVFVYEIIRNLYEENGEREMECHTIPIVYGKKAATNTIYAILAIVNVACISYIFSNFSEMEFVYISYYICTTLAFSLGLTMLLNSAEHTKDYKTCLSVVILLICSVVAFSIVFAYTHPNDWIDPTV